VADLQLVEQYTNYAQTTAVGSTGSTAPASGTSETWQVTSSASFPTASTSAGSGFHVADPAAPTESIAVTNVSGTTWTVTRGAEGSTPVMHATGFIIRQVLTAGVFKTHQAVILPSGDVTGVKDATAINNAATLLNTNGTGGTVFLGPGDFYISTQITLPQPSGAAGALDGLYAVSLRGTRGTVIHQLGATGIFMHRAAGYNNQNNSPNPMARQGSITDIVLDGASAPAGAVGMDVGDGWGYQVDACIRNFDSSGAIAFYQANRHFWTEKGNFRLDIINCANGVVVDCLVYAGDCSHEYTDWDLRFYLLGAGATATGGGQNGIIYTNGSYNGGGKLRMRGNHGGGYPTTTYSYTATSASPCVFTAAGSSYNNGAAVQLTSGSGTQPGGFTEGTTYYIVNVSGATFQLAATAGGAGINSSSTGSGTVGKVGYNYTATNASPCVFTAVGSGFPNGTLVQLIGGTVPAGFLGGLTYYVVGSSGATFQLAATPGGTAVNSTSTGSGLAQYSTGALMTVYGDSNAAGLGGSPDKLSSNYNTGYDIVLESNAAVAGPVFMVLGNSTTGGNVNHISGHGQLAAQFAGWVPSVLNGTSYVSVIGNVSGDTTLTTPKVPSIPSSGIGSSHWATNNGPSAVVTVASGTSVNISINGTALGTATGPVVVLAGQQIGLGAYGGSPTWTWAPLTT